MPPPGSQPVQLTRQQRLLLLVVILVIVIRHIHRMRRMAQRRMELQMTHIQVYRPAIPYIPKIFTLDGCGWDDIQCKEFFRFTKDEIRRFLPLLRLDLVPWRYGYRPIPEEALCILLYRLSYPQRLKDCLELFGCSRSRLSVIFNDTVCWLVSRYQQTLWWDRHRLTLETLRRYEEAIKKVTGLSGIWGFVDGTMRAFCRPGQEQRAFYSGYKKSHGYKFQSIVTPDGLLSSLVGPFPGPVGDWIIWRSSGISEILRELFISDSPLYVFGDSAYAPSFGVMGPYIPSVNNPLTQEQEAANLVMSGERIVVEWGFGRVVNYWALNSFKNQLKLGLSPVAAYYMVATLLSNILLCIRGHSQISEKYGLCPPSVEEYLYLD